MLLFLLLRCCCQRKKRAHTRRCSARWVPPFDARWCESGVTLPVSKQQQQQQCMQDTIHPPSRCPFVWPNVYQRSTYIRSTRIMIISYTASIRWYSVQQFVLLLSYCMQACGCCMLPDDLVMCSCIPSRCRCQESLHSSSSGCRSHGGSCSSIALSHVFPD